MSAVIQSVPPWTLPAPFAPMQAYPQWFIYRLHDCDPASGKYLKDPIDPRTRVKPPKGHGGISMCVDWPTVAQIGAELRAGANAGELYLPGFYFTEADPFWFFDIDKCVVQAADGTRAWSPLALSLLERFPTAARAVSSSGQGWHVIGTGKAPDHGCKNTALDLEFYTQDRGIALAGVHASGDAGADCTTVVSSLVAEYFPPGSGTAGDWTFEPVWHRATGTLSELMERERKRNATLDALLAGNKDALKSGGDDSSVDFALCCELLRLNGGNDEELHELMQSGTLALHRDKWSSEYYRRRTISRAHGEVAKDPPPDPNLLFGTGVTLPPGASLTPVSTGTIFAAAGVDLVCAANITPEAIRWLWAGWLPSGKLVILAGPEGTGKSTVAFALSATVSNGGVWPDKVPFGERHNVVIWSGEDDAADTIVPRLIAAGADLNRVHIIRGKIDANNVRLPFDPATDMPQLEQRIQAIGGAALLVVDPIVSAVAGDMHKASEVRRSLQALVDLGARFDCAVLGITHFRKSSQGTTPRERVIGSQAFSALARLVLVVMESEEDGRRVMARAKSNISKDRDGIEYSIAATVIRENIATTKIEWGEIVDGTARELLDDAERDPETADIGECAKALSMTLRDANGREVEMPKKVVEDKLKKEGYSAKQIRRAREKLGVLTRLDGFGAEGKGMWRLPEGPP